MKPFLRKPYPIETDARRLWSTSLAFGAFVFLFLYVFQPFGLSEVKGHILVITLGYGFVTSIVMSLMFFGVRPLLPNHFNETRWNVGKEILDTMIVLVLVAFGNVLYSYFIGFFRFNFEILMVFLGFTLAVGIFPVFAQVLIRQNALQKKFIAGSESINEDIEKKVVSDDMRTVTLRDEDEKDVITCTVDQLIAMESADNYVKIYLSDKDGEKSIMVRNALGKYESELAIYDHFFRTHRTFLVNLDKLEHVDGNARGYSIKLRGLAKPIPVARRRTNAFDKAVASR